MRVPTPPPPPGANVEGIVHIKLIFVKVIVVRLMNVYRGARVQRCQQQTTICVYQLEALLRPQSRKIAQTVPPRASVKLKVKTLSTRRRTKATEGGRKCQDG